MAAAPLFVATLALLQDQLRLSTIGATDPAGPIIDNTVTEVRAGFYARLGAPRVAQLVALTFVESPTSNDEALRAVANTAETNWVRLRLLCLLPTLFRDESGDTQAQWSEDGLTREQPSYSLDRQKRDLERLIEEAMDFLSAEEQIGEGVEIEVFDGTPAAGKETLAVGASLSRNLNITSYYDGTVRVAD